MRHRPRTTPIWRIFGLKRVSNLVEYWFAQKLFVIKNISIFHNNKLENFISTDGEETNVNVNINIINQKFQVFILALILY